MDIAQFVISSGGNRMRRRKAIEEDASRKDVLILEVLLDIRDCLVKATKKKVKREGKI